MARTPLDELRAIRDRAGRKPAVGPEDVDQLGNIHYGILLVGTAIVERLEQIAGLLGDRPSDNGENETGR